MRYELTLQQYAGPIEKLLELIEARELAVTEISLAAVTDDFLKYLETITHETEKNADYMRLLADFIVIASRLVFIKSKALIPDITLSDEEEAGIKDLEDRLKLYQELKPVIKALGSLWKNGSHELSREYFLHVKGLLLAIRAQSGNQDMFFYPGGATSQTLSDALRKVLVITEKPVAEETLIQEKIVSLEVKIKEIVARLTDLRETTFRTIANGASKVEMIVAFLAVLHLARDQMVTLRQDGHGSDIIIQHYAPQS